MCDKTLSIIIPSYNMEGYLPKCLESLIVDDRELFLKLDIIVVNDGSKDRTSEIAHDFASRYPSSVTVIDKPNGNYGSCINAALPNAKGWFIKILDADDSFDRLGFQTFLGRLDKMDDSVDVVLTPFVQVDGTCAVVKETRYDCPVGQIFDRDVFNDKVGWAYMHSVTYRTGMLREILYKQTEGISYTDTEWVFLPIAAAKSFIYENIPVYRYLVGRVGQTVSKEATVKSFVSYKRLLESMSLLYKDVRWSGRELNYISLMASMRRIVLLIYTIEILDLSIGAGLKEFDQTDTVIRSNCPDLYSEFDESTFSRTLQWHYIRFIRRHRRVRYFYVVMLRLYSILLRRIKRGIPR